MGRNYDLCPTQDKTIYLAHLPTNQLLKGRKMKKITMSSFILLNIFIATDIAVAETASTTCGFSVTNHYEDKKYGFGRQVVVYKGSDTILSTPFQFASINYGHQTELNCGKNQSSCKIRWSDIGVDILIAEWEFGTQIIYCGEHYIVSSASS